MNRREFLPASVTVASIALLGSLLFGTLTSAQVCSNYNDSSLVKYENGDRTQHSGFYAHGWQNDSLGSCEYSGTTGANADLGPCKVVATASSVSYDLYEEGHLAVLGYHFVGSNDTPNATASNTGAASTESLGAFAVGRCTSPGCTMNVGINGPPFNYTVTYTHIPIWNDLTTGKASCKAQVGVCNPNPSTPPGTGPGPGCSWQWDYTKCTWVMNCPTSPLIVDTTGKGFHLSDPKTDCITFDLKGDGNLDCWSWPVHGSGNAWLVYDRDGDGVIDSGQELFGNFTPHSDGYIPGRPNPFGHSPNPNGFLALAWYDQRAQGGNVDVIIDEQDKIWPKLKLWIDEHCYQNPQLPCSALPNELYTLESKGIRSISLAYMMGDGSQYDDYGNRFRFKAMLNPTAKDKPRTTLGWCCLDHQTSKDGRLIYDVYLQSKEMAEAASKANQK